VLATAQPATVGELRRFLQAQVPAYMVPAVFVLRDALPLTANGKVDREALPGPEFQRQLEEAYVPPQTRTEHQIAAIWREVLQVEQVGREDNFFELGGNSLLLTQVHSKLCDAFGRELSMVELFQAPTISTLATHYDRQSGVQGTLRPIAVLAQQQRAALLRQKQRMHEVKRER